jgi:heme exporter protein C
MLAALLVAVVAFTLAGGLVFRRRLRTLARADAAATAPAVDVPAPAEPVDAAAPLTVVPRGRP